MSSTSSSNFRRNKAEINMFRKELEAMVEDIEEIDVRVLNKSVNEGVKVTKSNTPVITGFMHRSWRSEPAVKTKGGGTSKTIVNTADYSPFVNYGHRLVNKAGETTGFVKGQFTLEKGISHTEKTMKTEFEKEVERVNREHDK